MESTAFDNQPLSIFADHSFQAGIQLKIEKSLLAGHARLLQDMMAERKVKLLAARVSAEPAGKAGSHVTSLQNPAKPKWRRRVKPDMDTQRFLNEILNNVV